MKLRVFLTGTILILAMAMTAAGAEIAGKWVAEQQGPQGTQETVFNFTVNGGVLTGTISGGRGGDAKISEGKIEGNDVSFAVVNTMGDVEMRTLYRGKITGDEIRFTIERQGAPGGQRGGSMGASGGGAPKSKPDGSGMGAPGGGAPKSKPDGSGMGTPGGGAPKSKPDGGGMGAPGGQRGGGAQELIAKRAK